MQKLSLFSDLCLARNSPHAPYTPSSRSPTVVPTKKNRLEAGMKGTSNSRKELMESLGGATRKIPDLNLYFKSFGKLKRDSRACIFGDEDEVSKAYGIKLFDKKFGKLMSFTKTEELLHRQQSCQ